MIKKPFRFEASAGLIVLAFTEPGTILASNLSVVLGPLFSAVAGVSVLYLGRPRRQRATEKPTATL